MKRIALGLIETSLLLAVAGCASTTRTPLARFPWIDAIRHAPPVLVEKCERVWLVSTNSDAVFCHPDPDQPPGMDQAARLVGGYDVDTTTDRLFHLLDANPNGACAATCKGPAPALGCWATCQLLRGYDIRLEDPCSGPQQKAPTHLPAKTVAAPGLAFDRAPSATDDFFDADGHRAGFNWWGLDADAFARALASAGVPPR